MKRALIHKRSTAASVTSLLLAFTCLSFWVWGSPAFISLPGSVSAALAGEAAQERTISEFTVQPSHKAVRLIWEASIPEGKEVTFEIHRAMVSPDAQYTLVTAIQGKPGTTTHRYTDKSIPAEENYFYKIEIPQTRESYGPLQVRPPFSLPST